MSELVIDVHDLQKSFGTHKVVYGLNLRVAAGAPRFDKRVSREWIRCR